MPQKGNPISNFVRVSVDPATGQSEIGGAAPSRNYGLI